MKWPINTFSYIFDFFPYSRVRRNTEGNLSINGDFPTIPENVRKYKTLEEKQEKIENKDEDEFDDETKKNIEFQKRIEG